MLKKPTLEYPSALLILSFLSSSTILSFVYPIIGLIQNNDPIEGLSRRILKLFFIIFFAQLVTGIFLKASLKLYRVKSRSIRTSESKDAMEKECASDFRISLWVLALSSFVIYLPINTLKVKLILLFLHAIGLRGILDKKWRDKVIIVFEKIRSILFYEKFIAFIEDFDEEEGVCRVVLGSNQLESLTSNEIKLGLLNLLDEMPEEEIKQVIFDCSQMKDFAKVLPPNQKVENQETLSANKIFEFLVSLVHLYGLKEMSFQLEEGSELITFPTKISST